MKRRRVNKKRLLLVVVLLVLVLVSGFKLVQLTSSPKSLEVKDSEVYVLDANKEISLNVDYTNSKKLNKYLNKHIETFVQANKEELSDANKKYDVKLQLNNEKNLGTWIVYGDQDVLATMILDTKNSKQIDIGNFYQDNLEGFSMLVREELAKDEELKYNRNTYTKTVPEAKNFSNIVLASDGLEILFSKEKLNVDNVKTIKLAYKDVLPYLNKDVAKVISSDNVSEDVKHVRYIDPNKPMIAFTFDDGPNSATTKKLGNHFFENDARVTFFALGSRIENDPETVLEMHNLGHEIANHSYDHQNFNKISDTELSKQTDFVTNMIKDITKQEKVLIRPPYGSINQKTRVKISNPLILWQVDPEDWVYKDENIVYNNLEKSVYDGSIVVMHDLYPTTVDAVNKFLDTHKDEYQFVTVSEMFAYKGNELVDGELYFFAKGD